MNIEKFIQIAAPLGVLGLKVTQNDTLIADWHSEPEMRRNVYSATKSFTCCAVGFAVQEGLLSLDEKLTEAFASDLPEQIGEHLAEATVRDLLTMCLGEEKPQLMGEQRPLYEEDDWVKMSLSFPLIHKPGTHFLYSNVGPYLAGVLVQRRAGCDLRSYLTPRLFSHRKKIRRGTPSGREDFSSLFPNCTLSDYSACRKAAGTDGSFFSPTGLRNARKNRDLDLTVICSGAENITPSGRTASSVSYPSFSRIRTPSYPWCPNAGTAIR